MPSSPFIDFSDTPSTVMIACRAGSNASLHILLRAVAFASLICVSAWVIRKQRQYGARTTRASQHQKSRLRITLATQSRQVASGCIHLRGGQGGKDGRHVIKKNISSQRERKKAEKAKEAQEEIERQTFATSSNAVRGAIPLEMSTTDNLAHMPAISLWETVRRMLHNVGRRMLSKTAIVELPSKAKGEKKVAFLPDVDHEGGMLMAKWKNSPTEEEKDLRSKAEVAQRWLTALAKEEQDADAEVVPSSSKWRADDGNRIRFEENGNWKAKQ